MIITACFLLTISAAVYVLAPLFMESKGNLEVELLGETEMDRLMGSKAVVYSNLKELEFEYKMGRLGDADYKRLEAGYRSEAAAILEKLDRIGVSAELDEKIEKEVSARKGRLHTAPAPKGAAECPECGAAAVPGKKFCADCGHRL